MRKNPGGSWYLTGAYGSGKTHLLYRQKHGLTVTGNYSMSDLVEQERMHPSIVRRLDDMCRVIEL
jgi:hypothetical protein